MIYGINVEGLYRRVTAMNEITISVAVKRLNRLCQNGQVLPGVLGVTEGPNDGELIFDTVRGQVRATVRLEGGDAVIELGHQLVTITLGEFLGGLN